MKALVISASRHGSTHEIAEAIARELREQQVDVDRRRLSDGLSLEGYDAVVLGSAVYIGHWLPEAMRFVEENRVQLSDRAVYLFSSGPLGEDQPAGGIDEHLVTKLTAETRARGHKIFSGALQPTDLGLKEKLVTKVVRAPSGDFRDWEQIRAWARAIADDLAVV